MVRLLRWMSPVGLLLFLAVVGCTEPNTAHPGGGGWLNDDVQVPGDADATGQDATGGRDVVSPADVHAVEDSGTSPADVGGLQDAGPNVPQPDANGADISVPADAGADTATPDAAPSVDVGPADTGAPDTLSPGEDCQTNAQCGAGYVCCNEGFGGRTVCKEDSACRFGGLCQDDDECGQGQQCCSLGFQNRKACADRCFGNGNGGNDGGSGAACQTGADCSAAGEVCCAGVGGNTCRNNCQFGKVCSGDAECDSGERCCSVIGVGTQVCLSESFAQLCN